MKKKNKANLKYLMKMARNSKDNEDNELVLHNLIYLQFDFKAKVSLRTC
jgi:hypothetical protein